MAHNSRTDFPVGIGVPGSPIELEPFGKRGAVPFLAGEPGGSPNRTQGPGGCATAVSRPDCRSYRDIRLAACKTPGFIYQQNPLNRWQPRPLPTPASASEVAGQSRPTLPTGFPCVNSLGTGDRTLVGVFPILMGCPEPYASSQGSIRVRFRSATWKGRMSRVARINRLAMATAAMQASAVSMPRPAARTFASSPA